MEVEKEVILAALEKTGGNKTEAARQLGTLRAKRCWRNLAVSLFTFDGAPADIATAKATVPANVGQQLIGARCCSCATESPSAVTHSTRPPLVTTRWSSEQFGAGVEDLTVCDFLLRQAVRSHRPYCSCPDSRRRQLTTPSDARSSHSEVFSSSLPAQAAEAQLDQVGLHAQHDRLGFRVAKAAVELNHLRVALLVDHQTGVEETGIGVAFSGHAFHGWPDNPLHGALVDFVSNHRRREYAPIPPVFGPVSPLPTRL